MSNKVAIIAANGSLRGTQELADPGKKKTFSGMGLNKKQDANIILTF